MKVGIIDFGAGNVRSIENVLNYLEVGHSLIDEHPSGDSFSHIIFPGVGHAAAAMTKMQYKGLDQFILQSEVPVLGICLGLQLMCAHTEEGDVEGLGIFDRSVIRFQSDFPVPHMGWNQIENQLDPLFKGIPASSYYYFVHSYYIQSEKEDGMLTQYGHTRFTSVMQKEHFYGCQFHPEKSGKAGLQIIQNFLDL